MAILPNESLAEVVAFFKLFDLSVPLLTSSKFSVLAADAALRIPKFYMYYVDLFCRDYPPVYSIYVSQSESRDDEEHVVVPAELLPIALSNCVIQRLNLFCQPHPSVCVARAIREEAAHFAVAEIELESSCFPSIEELVDFLTAFRKLEAVGIIDYKAKFHRSELRGALQQNDLILAFVRQKKRHAWKQTLKRFASSFVKTMRRVVL